MGMRDYASLYAHRYSTGVYTIKGCFSSFTFSFLSSSRSSRSEPLEDLLSDDALSDSGTLF